MFVPVSLHDMLEVFEPLLVALHCNLTLMHPCSCSNQPGDGRRPCKESNLAEIAVLGYDASLLLYHKRQLMSMFASSRTLAYRGTTSCSECSGVFDEPG